MNTRAKGSRPYDPRKVTEADVLKAVKQLLEAKGFRCFRRNTGAVRATYTSTRTGKKSERFVRFSEPGMADLWGWAPEQRLGGFLGKHFEIEIKAPKKRPSLEQQGWLEFAYNGGCIAFWADSVEMAEAKLKEWGL